MSDPSQLASETSWADPRGDSELVAQAQAGCKDAFEVLVHRYASRVYHRAYAMLRDEDLAFDLAQMAWIKAWQRLEQFAGQSLFSTWMTRVTINVCLDYLRKSKRWRFDQSLEAMQEIDSHAEGKLPVVDVDPLERLELEEKQALVDQALKSLSDEHRSVILMHTYEHMTYKEIADTMECSIGTVMSRLYYARKRMAILLGPLIEGKLLEK